MAEEAGRPDLASLAYARAEVELADWISEVDDVTTRLSALAAWEGLGQRRARLEVNAGRWAASLEALDRSRSSLRHQQPVRLAHLQTHLQADEAVLAFRFLGAEAWVWLVRSSQVHSMRLAASASEVQDAADLWVESISTGRPNRSWRRLGWQLARLTMHQVESAGWLNGLQNLIVLPGGGLATLPLDSLPTLAHADRPYGDGIVFSRSRTISDLDRSLHRRPRGHSTVAFIPNGSPAALLEVEGILMRTLGRAFLGRRATEQPDPFRGPLATAERREGCRRAGVAPIRFAQWLLGVSPRSLPSIWKGRPWYFSAAIRRARPYPARVAGAGYRRVSPMRLWLRGAAVWSAAYGRWTSALPPSSHSFSTLPEAQNPVQPALPRLRRRCGSGILPSPFVGPVPSGKEHREGLNGKGQTSPYVLTEIRRKRTAPLLYNSLHPSTCAPPPRQARYSHRGPLSRRTIFLPPGATVKTVIKLLKRVATLSIVAGVGYFGWMYWQERQAAEEEEGLGEVPTQAAEVRDITVSVSATGTLRPVRIVQVKSKAAGEILRMPAELGDRVETGALIAQIDTETLDQELVQGAGRPGVGAGAAGCFGAPVRPRPDAVEAGSGVAAGSRYRRAELHHRQGQPAARPSGDQAAPRSASTMPRCALPTPARLSARRWRRE